MKMRIERGKEREKKLVVEKNTRKGREQEIEIWMGIRIPDPRKYGDSNSLTRA